MVEVDDLGAGAAKQVRWKVQAAKVYIAPVLEQTQKTV
jgi:hypothetical protein